MAQFHSNLSYESDPADFTTATHIHIIISFILSKGFID